jgi:hypothetical protein
MVGHLDRSNWVRRVASFEDVQLLFMETEVSAASETPFAETLLNYGQNSIEIENVDPHMSNNAADLNDEEDVMGWLLVTVSLEEE